MAIPGQIIFVFAADYLNQDNCTLHAYFVVAYVIVSVLQVSYATRCTTRGLRAARSTDRSGNGIMKSLAVFQVMFLLYVAHIMIHAMWRYKIDPDNSAIPYLTALGDLSGSLFLALAFWFIYAIHREYCTGK